MLFIALLISSCKKSSNNDGSTPNPEIKNYRIAKIMFDPASSDSVVFDYINNHLSIISHYHYFDGHQVRDKFLYYYNPDNTVSMVIKQYYGSFRGDTTFYIFQNNLLSKINYRYSYDDMSGPANYKTKINADITISNALITQLLCSYNYHHTWYYPPTVYQDSIQYTSTASFSYNGNNIIKQSLINQFGHDGSVIYEYDSKINPIKLSGAMPTLYSFSSTHNLSYDSTDCVSLTSPPIDNYLNDFCCLCSNNITKETHSNYTISYQYEYNSIGLPTKALISNKKGASIILFIYEQIN